MKRTGPLAVFSTFLVGLAACATEPRSTDAKEPGDPASQPNQMHGITLTAAVPRQELAVSPPIGATTLDLTIAAIENPSSQAFSVAASLVWSSAAGAPTEVSIGSVTPFPATQPGSFVLTLPEAGRKQLAGGNSQLTLRLSLEPIAADRSLAEPLRVTVGDPAWH
jgi:hypothetical protein